MKRLQAYKFQLKTTGAQERQMRRYAGSCRFMFNHALAWQKAQYLADPSIKFSYVTLANLLPQSKNDCPWLKEAPSQALQQSLKDLERAYQHFFAQRADFPRFKKRGQGDRFRFPQGVLLDQANHRIKLPKLGWIRYRNSREVLGEVKNVTVSQANGQWVVSIQTEREVEQSVSHATYSLGIDMGISRFATISDGSFIAPLDSFRSNAIKLARHQRAMSRKVKFSQHWVKTKASVTKLHRHIANTRRDFLHKATTTISQNHAMVFVEDLNVSNMSKSAAGSLASPGRHVQAKSGLNKAILDQGWFEFRRQLEYKLTWHGGQLIAVPPPYTSQRCSCCGLVSKENRKTQNRFACLSCGYTAHADVNAALNIKAAGHAVLACGETVQSDHSMKQEPTQETTHVSA